MSDSQPAGRTARPLGLPQEALHLYDVLRAEPASVAELSERLPEIDVADALSCLREVRLVRTAGTEDVYIANPPQVAADELLRYQESAASVKLAELARMREDFGRLVDDRRPGVNPAASLTEVISDSSLVRERIAELSAGALESVWAAHPNLPSPEALEAGAGLDIERSRSGIHIRGLYPHAARRHHLHAQHLRAIEEAGCEVRTASMIPFRAIIFDSAMAIIPRPGTRPGAAIVRDPLIVGFVVETYESLWQGGLRFGGADADDDVDAVAAAMVTAIMSELALGHTDDAIARRLGISTRTLRRYLSKVSGEYNAQTRYQLGMVAERHFNIGDAPPEDDAM